MTQDNGSSGRPSKKHHFVPQAQLRHFAADAERNFVYVFDKTTDRSFRTSIKNAGSENGFNIVDTGEERWNFEYLFEAVDARSATLVDEVVSRRSVGWLTADDRTALADLFSTQILRTHFSRTTPKYIAERMREIIRDFGYDPDANTNMAAPKDSDIRLGAARAFLDRKTHITSLLRLHPALYAVGGAGKLFISDHPVTRTNAFPDGDNSLTSPGVLIYLPVSPDLAIGLHCSTIVRLYQQSMATNIVPERQDRIRRVHDGLSTGNPIEADAEMAAYLNAHQIEQSAKFLYSDADDFDFARIMLREHPDLRMVQTHVVLGEMGQAPPPRPGMPAGMHLVINGAHDRCMMAIEEIDDTGEGLTLRTKDLGLLSQVEDDQSMLQANFYVDGRQVRHLKEAMVERFGPAPKGWFRVIHRDEGMRALAAMVDPRKT